MHQKNINLFIDKYTATYIKNNLRAICASRGVNCSVILKYKMINNASLKVILQGHDLNILNDIESKLNSLNGKEVGYELISNESITKEIKEIKEGEKK